MSSHYANKPFCEHVCLAPPIKKNTEMKILVLILYVEILIVLIFHVNLKEKIGIGVFNIIICWKVMLLDLAIYNLKEISF
jgi:hypothetical protein